MSTNQIPPESSVQSGDAALEAVLASIANIDQAGDIGLIYKVLLAVLKREAAEIKRRRGDGGLDTNTPLSSETLRLDSEVEQSVLCLLINLQCVAPWCHFCSRGQNGPPCSCRIYMSNKCLDVFYRPIATSEGHRYFIDLSRLQEERRLAQERHDLEKRREARENKELRYFTWAFRLSCIALLVSGVHCCIAFTKQFSQSKPVEVQLIESLPFSQQSVMPPTGMCTGTASLKQKKGKKNEP